MGVEHVGTPLPDKRADRIGKRVDLAPFAQAAGAGVAAVGAVEGEAVGYFQVRAVDQVAKAGDPAYLDRVGHLCLHDRTRAKGIAAVQRQRVIEHVKNPEHTANTGTTTLTARQPSRAKGCISLGRDTAELVDIATLLLTHGLMALALWRLLPRPELDVEDARAPHRPWIKPSPDDVAGDIGGA